MSYRKYESGFETKKYNFLVEFKLEHPRIINFYDNFNNKDKYKRDYVDLYQRCIYCGSNFKYIPLSSIEIDHVNPKKPILSNKEDQKNKEQNPDNLVCTCRSCNRNKSNTILPDNLHPDNGFFDNYLKRNGLYEIVPKNNEPVERELIRIFNFDSKKYKLAFLMEDIYFIIDKIEDSESKNKLNEIMRKIIVNYNLET